MESEVPFQLRASAFTAMVLRVLDPAHPDFFTMLRDKVSLAPGFYHNVPVVLNLDAMSPDGARLDITAFAQQMVELKLIPVGIQGGTPAQQSAALALGLPLMSAGRGRSGESGAGAGTGGSSDEVSASAAAAADLRESASGGVPPLVITEPVRSGRQIYAPRGDLVVLAAVSSGAELLADGSIHVYGALRGRALAGLSGDSTARIFCLSLEAELVSIANLYRVNEDIESRLYKKPAQIYLSEGYLHLMPLTIAGSIGTGAGSG